MDQVQFVSIREHRPSSGIRGAVLINFCYCTGGYTGGWVHRILHELKFDIKLLMNWVYDMLLNVSWTSFAKAYLHHISESVCKIL